MNRSFISVSLVLVALSFTSCATGAKAYMDGALSNRAEPASVWSRPQEVGFDWGSEISAEVSNQCVLMFICWGYEDGGGIGGAISSIFAGLSGAKEVGDPLVRAAAAVAVANAPKADGIFVLAHDTDSFNIFLYSKRTARVKGKSFTLRNMGEVSQDRADKVRNLRSVGNGTINLGDMLR